MLEFILVQGTITGGMYALLAVGFSLIFGVARIINVAHVSFYMLAAFLVYTFSSLLGLNPGLSIILVLLVTILIGLGSYRFLIEPIREHETSVIIITMAIALIIQEAMRLSFGADPLPVPYLIPGYVELLGIRVLYQQLLTLGIALVALIAIWVLLTKSRLGIALRAIAQDREVANLMGINIPRICLLTMAIAAGLAAIAGIIAAPLFTVNPYMWLHPLVMVLAIVILGGLGSFTGSFVGAFILGYAEILVVFLLPGGTYLKGPIALLLMLIILLVRPAGLFGVAFEEEM